MTDLRYGTVIHITAGESISFILDGDSVLDVHNKTDSLIYALHERRPKKGFASASGHGFVVITTSNGVHHVDRDAISCISMSNVGELTGASEDDIFKSIKPL